MVSQTWGNEREALAGAGDLDEARDRIRTLLENNVSETVKSALRMHLDRAGHPELLDPNAPGATAGPAS